MTKRTDLESGAAARLHDTKTRDLLEAESDAALRKLMALPFPQFKPEVLQSVAQAQDAQAEQQFRQAVRQLVRSRSYGEIRQLLDEELEGKRS